MKNIVNNIPRGLCWAKKRDDNSWELVEVRMYNLELVVYFMGWDCPVSTDHYSEFVKACLIDPDGKEYR